MWGRQWYGNSPGLTIGNTPTGVGKTPRRRKSGAWCRKHPHGCGEDLQLKRMPKTGLETPPRVWGRLARTSSNSISSRNTPTGVGKTTLLPSEDLFIEKHPHGCGEDSQATLSMVQPWETPPRVWGRPAYHFEMSPVNGNTPTGVGKTKPPLAGSRPQRETPPRVWGRPNKIYHRSWSAGNTPTGVGKTHGQQNTLPLYRKHPHGCGEDA